MVLRILGPLQNHRPHSLNSLNLKLKAVIALIGRKKPWEFKRYV